MAKKPTPKTDPSWFSPTIKKLNVRRIGTHEAAVPSLATKGASGYDLEAVNAEPEFGSDGMLRIAPGQLVTILTGFAVEIPEGYVGMLVIRSGRARAGLFLANGCGIIDSDYRGEIKAMVRNLNEDEVSIKKGTRVAQLVVVPALAVGTEETSELSETERGDGGFGSTGE